MTPMRRTVESIPELLLISCAVLLFARFSHAQSAPYQRTYPQSKAVVEKTLQALQPSASGRLPVLNGFISSGDRQLDRFDRGYYQCAVQVSSTPSGGALVRVSANITAWYTDPVPAPENSGYQTLPSNGRLETDLLDRLQDALSGKTSPVRNTPPTSAPEITPPPSSQATPEGSIAGSKIAAAPANSPFKLANPLSSDHPASLATQKAVADKHKEGLTKEAKNLEEILRNQAHPNNLVAIKKPDTPVLASPIEGAKVLFLAAAEDEFEILDMNASWVHVRISGLSRGWIRRSGLEMPESVETHAVAAGSPSNNPSHFQVKDEQTTTFPGTWEPLRGKTVKILTVQETAENSSATGPRAKLEFAKALFVKEYAELARASTTAAGVVLIFDSVDGGMAAAALPTLAQWQAGALSDQAFWLRCFFDPPETFSSHPGQ